MGDVDLILFKALKYAISPAKAPVIYAPTVVDLGAKLYSKFVSSLIRLPICPGFGTLGAAFIADTALKRPMAIAGGAVTVS